MGRQPCCDKVGLKKGPWTAEEDRKLVDFIIKNGHCCWRTVPKLAGNLTIYCSIYIYIYIYLWAKIAAHLPGRTDNEIKNYWNTHIKKKLKRMGIDPLTHQPIADAQPAQQSQVPLITVEVPEDAGDVETQPIPITALAMVAPAEEPRRVPPGFEPPTFNKDPHCIKVMKQKVSDRAMSSGSTNQSEVTYILEDDKSTDSCAQGIPSRLGFNTLSMFGEDVKASDPETSCKMPEKQLVLEYNEKLDAGQSWDSVAGNNNPMLLEHQETAQLMLQTEENLWEFADLVGCFNKGNPNGEDGMDCANVVAMEPQGLKWAVSHEPTMDMLVTGSIFTPGEGNNAPLWLQPADPLPAPWEGANASSNQAFYPALRRLAASLDSI
eukprot:Gb_05777 [translate_table: standard]